MTDKPIIIDGISLYEVKEKLLGVKDFQLQQHLKKIIENLEEKTTECEKLEKINKANLKAGKDLNKEITLLQHKVTECEELKSENFTFEELVKIQEKVIDRYKHALDEIAYLIRSVNGSLLEIVNNDIQSYLVKEGCDALDVIKQILDIISKAKGEENAG